MFRLEEYAMRLHCLLSVEYFKTENLWLRLNILIWLRHLLFAIEKVRFCLVLGISENRKTSSLAMYVYAGGSPPRFHNHFVCGIFILLCFAFVCGWCVPIWNACCFIFCCVIFCCRNKCYAIVFVRDSPETHETTNAKDGILCEQNRSETTHTHAHQMAGCVHKWCDCVP